MKRLVFGLCVVCVAVVLDVDGATTVITCRADPVESRNGRLLRIGCSAGGRCEVVVLGAGRFGAGFAAVVVGADVFDTEVGGVDVVGDDVLVEGAAARWVVALHAPRASAAITAGTSRRSGGGTRPASHATPMRIRGWVPGVSQRMSGTSRFCGIATQPAVAWPFVTCRKNALPAPACTGKRL